MIRLQLADLGPATVLAFLDYLETERHNCAATRNCRLIAIHRFFAYVADRDPRHVDLCRRFPYTAMTGGPAKIIASANGCTLPPAPASAPDNGHRWHTCRTAGCERPFADEGGGRLP